MRKLKYSLATTVDGFIAQKDGSFNRFIMEGEHVTDFQNAFEQFDTVLMGRKTYEVGLNFGVSDPYPTMKQYVFSHTMKESPNENVEIVSEDAAQFVRDLKTKAGKDIWLCGGGNLATVLLSEGLIDEIILKVNPIVFGTGIPLFSEFVGHPDLELINSKAYDNGVMLLSYAVKY